LPEENRKALLYLKIMKAKYLLPFVVIFFLFSFQLDEEVEDIGIIWRSERPLTWKDFSGKVDSESPYDAWTYSGIWYVYSWYYDNNTIRPDLNAMAYFDPEQSWIKKGKMTPELLAHEQQHFNISELHCRYFQERVDKCTYTLNVEAEIDSIYAVVHEAMLAMHIKYDEETDHFRNLEGQKKWNQFISDELKRLQEYSE
jgi:hypothetical protein